MQSKRILFAFIFMLILLSMISTWAQDDALPTIPFAAIQDDTLFVYGFTDTPQPVTLDVGVEPSETPEVRRRPLVWDDDGQNLYFSVDYGSIGSDIFFPVMQTDRDATTAQIVIPVTTFWYGVDYADGDLIYADFNTEASYPDGPEIFPYGEGNISIFAPVRHDVYRIPADGTGEAAFIGDFPQGVDCQGRPRNLSDAIYQAETAFRGNPLVLRATPHGIVHTFTCFGGGTALLDANTDTLLGNRLRRVQISPDERALVGVDDTLTNEDRGFPDELLLRYVDLETLETEILPTTDQPDQLAWGAPDTEVIYYSVITEARQIELSEEERAVLNDVTILFGGGERNATSIRRYNLATGEDEEIYSADAYAIGRMTATPDGRYLLFSQIPNVDVFVDAVMNSDDPLAEGARAAFYDLQDPNLYALDLATGETHLIAERVYFFTLNTAAYQEFNP